VPLGRAEVRRRRARGGPAMHVLAAADPLGRDSPLIVLARAGALALVNRVELDGNL
jgi:hypothetical protein